MFSKGGTESVTVRGGCAAQRPRSPRGGSAAGTTHLPPGPRGQRRAPQRRGRPPRARPGHRASRASGSISRPAARALGGRPAGRGGGRAVLGGHKGKATERGRRRPQRTQRGARPGAEAGRAAGDRTGAAPPLAKASSSLPARDTVRGRGCRSCRRSPPPAPARPALTRLRRRHPGTGISVFGAPWAAAHARPAAAMLVRGGSAPRPAPPRL